MRADAPPLAGVRQALDSLPSSLQAPPAAVRLFVDGACAALVPLGATLHSRTARDLHNPRHLPTGLRYSGQDVLTAWLLDAVPGPAWCVGH